MGPSHAANRRVTGSDVSSQLNSFGQPVGRDVPGWQPRPPPPRTGMRGRLCVLDPLRVADHAAPLFEAHALDREGRNWTYLPYGPFASFDDYVGWLRFVEDGNDPLFYTIVTAAGDPVGMASYLRIDPKMGSIEVGHLSFSPALQRTVAATEAMFLMMRRVFDELGYRRYEWKCDSLNAPSRRAAERLGFRYEGTFRQAVVVKGRNRDTAWFAITDSDWPPLRQAFEAWLAPANFDADGRQLRRLEEIRNGASGGKPAG